jgi:very-short-patch-repair endonuclease
MDLDAVARTHHGLATAAQAQQLGVSRRTLDRAVEAGRLERVAPSVYRLPGSPPTRHQRLLAAIYSAGHGAMASHRSAAWAWGVERPTFDPCDVIAPRTRHPLSSGVVVHRPTDVRDLRAVWRGAIPVVTPMRMLLDLGAVDPRGVAPALDHVLATKLMSLGAIDGALTRLAKKGRHGVTALRTAVEERRIDGKPSDSALEVRMHAVIATYNLPPMTFHAVVAGYEVDFLVIDVPVVVECIGWLYHGAQREQFEFDAARRAELAAAGHTVVEVTWRMLEREPGKVADRIRRVLATFSGDLETRGVRDSPEKGTGSGRGVSGRGSW